MKSTTNHFDYQKMLPVSPRPGILVVVRARIYAGGELMSDDDEAIEEAASQANMHMTQRNTIKKKKKN